MRACEGCRRRKIKCDAASTNVWPCAACLRFKLPCIPPTVNFNTTQTVGATVSGLERVLDFDNSSGGSGDEEYPPAPMAPNNGYPIVSQADLIAATQESFNPSLDAFHHPPYVVKAEGQPPFNVDSLAIAASNGSYPHPSTFLPPSYHPIPMPSEDEPWMPEEAPTSDLSDALGELKIDESGVGKSVHVSFGMDQC